MPSVLKSCTALLAVLIPIAAQTPEEFKVYTEQPRLILRPHRLRLLKKERERQSMRWEQFSALIAGRAQMTEPGLANCLYYAITGDPDAARQALDWAASAKDIRQIAIIYDWCHPALNPAQLKSLGSRLAAAASTPGSATFTHMRDRAFAAIAIADEQPAVTESAMRDIVLHQWRQIMVPQLEAGAATPNEDQLFALYELLHTIRDNLNIDLRENAVDWFKEIPPVHLLSHYPASYPAPENEYRIPAYDAEQEPDLHRAAESRATELMMVAYDSNASDSQFLQGWLMQDRYLMRSTFGSPYEFIWANPYQPGLSYYHFPLTHHDPATGALFVRSSWEDDAVWFGRVGSEWQTFRDGKITALDPTRPRDPIEIGATAIVMAHQPFRFQVKDAEHVYIIGLKPHTRYDVEVDEEEMREETSDAAGTLDLSFPQETTTGIRLHPSR